MTIIVERNGVHAVGKKAIIKKLGRLRKKKRAPSTKEAKVETLQFPSPPKGKPLIRIFKEKEHKEGTVVIEQVGGFIDFRITDDEKLIDSLIKQLAKGYYVKVDNLRKA